ncbi:MAG: YeeE/YedE family protein [Hyphomicrobiaceae bacterium]|nr:YeeE/YedE family protein [Hyphomicrobiaceae bacterium]
MDQFPTDFTPYASLGGGLLIGTAATLLMLFHGRIAGATGILAGILFPSGAKDVLWRVAFLAGMVTGPALFLAITGAMPVVTVPASLPMLVAGGFIVGIGVTLGGGCTSGHGVCGLARVAPRSIAATLTFMATTAVTVFILRHVIGG